MNGLLERTLSGMALHDGADFRLAYEVVKMEAPRRGLTLAQLAKRAGKNRTAFSRMANGDGVSVDTLRALEGPLGLPRDLLTYVAKHDRAAIESSGAEPDLVRWLSDQLPMQGRADTA